MADQRNEFNWEGRGRITQWNVKPVILKEIRAQHFPKTKQSESLPKNLVIEGDCGPVMKTLCADGKFRLKGQVDLMLWDPPYNTGKGEKGNTGNGFIYNDRFYLNRDLAEKEKESGAEWTQVDQLITDKNPSRHTHWLNFMELRLDLAKRLLAPTGVIAVHIGYQELFRLGLVMDQMFGEENRLGIVNWECAYSPKNDNKGIPSTTDYVLIYAKDKEKCYRGTLPRTEEMDARYKSPDGDKKQWTSGDFSAASGTGTYIYGIENPFTGILQYPPGGRYWTSPESSVRGILEKWGIKYEFCQEKNALVVKSKDRSPAFELLKKGPWPEIYFLGKNGEGRPRMKRYRDQLKTEGRVVGTYWPSEEILDDEDQTFSEALSHEISGHNDAGKKLLKAIMGDCPFDTPKPLKLTERLIKLFCPPEGTVLDAFGGSGTTAHGVLSLSEKEGANRRFIVIEYKPHKGSKQPAYANTITAERIRRVISGKWANPTKDTKPLPGQFAFYQEGEAVNRSHLLRADRIQLTDTILSLYDINGFTSQIPPGTKYVIGTTADHRPIVLHWNGQGESDFTRKIYEEVMDEVDGLGLTAKPMIVFAETCRCSTGKTVDFQRIPEDILLKLGIDS